MSTTTYTGFLEVAGRVEPKAIAAEIARAAHTRVAEAMTLTLDWLDEEGNPLNQKQKSQVIECVLRCMDGFEGETLTTLTEVFSKIEH